MKKLLTVISLALLSCSIWAQGGKDAVTMLKGMGSTRVEFTVQGRIGVADIQYPCFMVMLSDMHIYGDGKSMWVHNLDDGEVIVSKEILDGLIGDSVLSKDAKGRQTVVFNGPDGDNVSLVVTSMEKVAKPWEASHFTLDVEKLPDDVIVTDLR